MGYKTDVWNVRGTVSRNKTQHEEQTAHGHKNHDADQTGSVLIDK